MQASPVIWRHVALAAMVAAAGAAVPVRPLSAQGRDPHDAQPERPTVATHAGTVAPGWLEIETGVERDRGPSDARALLGTFVIKVGLAPRVQLSLFTTAVAPGDVSGGLGDIAIGVKWRLLEAHPVLGDFAVQPSVKFATGSVASARGTGTTDATLLFISSRDVGPVHMDLNAGWTHRDGSGVHAPRDAWVWTASFSGTVAGPLQWTAECFGYPGTGGVSGGAPVVALLAGPTYTARPWLVFDVGVIVPVAGAQAHAIYGGLTYNVGRLWGTREHAAVR